jgi:polyhydroxybutyrate depolymerase
LSDKVAAIAAFIANLPEHSKCKEPVKPVSVFICNGTKDPLMPWEGGTVARRGKVISALATGNFWINFDGTSKFPSQTKNFPDLDTADGSTVKSEVYAGGKSGTEIVFYTVAGGGHNVPSIDHKSGRLIDWLLGKQNHDVEGVREAWKFLSRQRL